MDDKNLEKELFEFEKPKKPLPKLFNIFSKTDFEGKIAIRLSPDKIIFIVIITMMLLVIVYALGVERGKVLSLKAPLPSVAISVAQGNITPIGKKSVMDPVISNQVKTALAVPTPSLPAKIGLVQASAKPYTIVAVTFSRKEMAETESNRLKGDGFDAFVASSDSYFLVCVGAYPDRDGVQTKKELNRVKRIYKDAYLKLR